MAKSVTRRMPDAKSGRFQIRNQKGQIRNQISPVMQKMKDMMPSLKAAQYLAFLINEPLSNCQKLLSGDRDENARQLKALLRSEHGRDVLDAIMGDARPAWYSKYRKQIEINEARRSLKESQRRIDALQDEASE